MNAEVGRRYFSEAGSEMGGRSVEGIARSLAPYCMETEYCDVGHPRIQRLAWELTRGIDDDQGRAVAIFRWVQDGIRYRILHNWSVRASETLVAGVGSCTNKANLFVALLRAVGIPAGYHVMRVRGKTYFGPVWIPMLQRLCDDVSVHLHAAVHLGGRWLKCDPSEDWALSDGASHLNPPSERVVFDGRSDAVSKIDPADVVGVSECLPSIDAFMEKTTSKPSIYFAIMNLFLDFGRQWGRSCASYELIEPKFRQWLVANHPQTYAAFLEAEAALIADDDPESGTASGPGSGPAREPRAEAPVSLAL